MSPQIFPPHSRLAPFLMHFMAVKLDGRESRMPAALSPHLMLCVLGATSIKGSDGSLLRRPRLALNKVLPGTQLQ
jgi:hypothetical protein